MRGPLYEHLSVAVLAIEECLHLTPYLTGEEVLTMIKVAEKHEMDVALPPPPFENDADLYGYLGSILPITGLPPA